jgi:hypothetical protein
MSENIPLAPNYQEELRTAYEQAEPMIEVAARSYGGKQILYGVVDPQVEVHSKEEYHQIMGPNVPEIDPGVFTYGLIVSVNRPLGFLHISGIGERPATLAFHSIVRGENYTVTIGDEVTAEGTTLELATKALKVLLATVKNEGRDDQRTPHLASTTNPAYVNPDGTPKHKG